MMTKTISKIAALGFVLFTTAFTPFAKADEWDKKTIITTHEPIRIEGKVLEPGQYEMKLLESADRHIVQIYDVDNSKLEMTVLAIPVYRLDPTGDTRLTFAETPDGQAPALRTWFYPGDNSGLEFSALR
jgi:hypothetical protein